MRLIDDLTEEVLVARDPALHLIEVRIETQAADTRVLHLTPEEARRLAARLLFETARLARDGSSVGWSYRESARRSA